MIFIKKLVGITIIAAALAAIAFGLSGLKNRPRSEKVDQLFEEAISGESLSWIENPDLSDKITRISKRGMYVTSGTSASIAERVDARLSEMGWSRHRERVDDPSYINTSHCKDGVVASFSTRAITTGKTEVTVIVYWSGGEYRVLPKKCRSNSP